MNRTPKVQQGLISLLLTVFLLSNCSLVHSQDFPLLPDDVEPVKAGVSESESNDAFLTTNHTPTSVAQLRQLETIFADVIEHVAPATVNIMVDEAQGSGVIISRDGYVLTAAHVIGRPNKFATITFADGSTASAITLGINRGMDSGMLKITDKGKWPFVDIGESSSLKKGQWAVSIGHPGGLTQGRGLVYRAGRILSLPEPMNDLTPWLGNNSATITTDCTLVGGDSGGPLLDLNGYVIGIHSRIGNRLTENYHVPIDAFSNEWDELVEAVIVGSKTAFIGVNLNRETNEVVIEEIIPNEGADNSGMKKGDVILKINDVETPDKRKFRAEMKNFKPKDVIKVVVKRGDEEQELEITLGYR